MKKVLFIFGTRPEAIKLAPIIKELKKYPNMFISVVCVTAQHRQMLDQVLRIFDIIPDYDLNIMQDNQSLYDIITKVINSLKDVIKKEKPDLVIVQGDTTTTFIGALVAFHERIAVGHVEAGLRTYDKYQPFPEEINRRLTSQLTDIHFAPTQRAKENIIKEGIDKRKVFITGNTVIDALLMVTKQQSLPEIQKKWEDYFISTFDINCNNAKRLILVTGHRRENFGEGFENICNALKDIALSYSNVEIVYPVHLNPNVQKPVNKILNGIQNIHLIPPLDYEAFIYLLSKSYLILTDSGGVQEEAPSLGKPVLVMRETTERPEGVEGGTVRLVGTDCKKIIEETAKLLQDQNAYNAMSTAHNPYGDGTATEKIVDIIGKYTGLII